MERRWPTWTMLFSPTPTPLLWHALHPDRPMSWFPSDTSVPKMLLTGRRSWAEPIYNDMIAYSKNSDLMQDEDFRKALGDSFIELAETDEGKEIFSVFSQIGYEWGDDANYDGERAAQELLKSLN